MTKTALETFTDNVRSDWGPLTSQLVAACSRPPPDATPEFAYTTRVEDKELLSKFKVGDKVDITWTEAMLVSVEDAK